MTCCKRLYSSMSAPLIVYLCSLMLYDVFVTCFNPVHAQHNQFLSANGKHQPITCHCSYIFFIQQKQDKIVVNVSEWRNNAKRLGQLIVLHGKECECHCIWLRGNSPNRTIFLTRGALDSKGAFFHVIVSNCDCFCVLYVKKDKGTCSYFSTLIRFKFSLQRDSLTRIERVD